MFGIIKRMFIVLLASIVNASNHTKCVSLIIKNARFNLLLLIYILMNTVKNFTTIHLRLNEIHVLEIVIVLMTYLKKYVFQLKLKI